VKRRAGTFGASSVRHARYELGPPAVATSRATVECEWLNRAAMVRRDHESDYDRSPRVLRSLLETAQAASPPAVRATFEASADVGERCPLVA